MKRILLLVLVMMSFLQCASSDSMVKPEKFDPFFIYEDEIRDAYYNNLYDFIYEARPAWLRGNRFTRLDGDKIFYPNVYLNNNNFGNHQSLKRLSVLKTYKVEYIKPEMAVTKFGVENMGGVILVNMYK